MNIPKKKPTDPKPVLHDIKPSDDFPSSVDLKVEMSDNNAFTYGKTTLENPPRDLDEYPPPQNTDVMNDTNETKHISIEDALQIAPQDDFSFGGSAEEVEEAMKRNAELVSNGFALSYTEDETLRPKVYDEDGQHLNQHLNSIACDVDLGDKAPVSHLSSDFIEAFDKPFDRTFQPKKDENNWKRLYFAQKGITAQLEKVIEDLERQNYATS